MKFSKQDMLDVENDDLAEDSPYKIVEVTDWEVEYKDYQSKGIYFKFEDKFYCLNSTRSGSYYSDYYYDSDDWPELVDCPEVEKVEVIKQEWRVKK